MATMGRDYNRTTVKSPVVPWLAAGLVGLSAASLMIMPWHAAARPTAESLPAAVVAFDAGDMAAGTAAFRTLAAHGDPHAAYWYGHALDRGLGVPANGTEAVVQFEKAWAGGVVPAATRLGEMYQDGNVVPQDFAKARTYLRDAAQRGDARAALDLGRMRRGGIGGTADPIQAYAWFEIAALHGNPQARLARDHLLASLTPAEQAAAAEQVTALQAPPATPKSSDQPAHAKP